jgi:hypothetical protein
MDPLVLGIAVLSAACFLAFTLWPRSSPRGKLEVVPAGRTTRLYPILGRPRLAYAYVPSCARVIGDVVED